MPRDVEAGKAQVELSVRDRLAAGLRKAQVRLRAFGAGLQAIGRQFAVAGAAILAPLGLMVKVFNSAGDQVEKMARRTGFSVEALSELGFAAEQSGTGLEELEKGVRRMQRSVFDLERGLATQTESFDVLGLTFEDLAGLAPEEQFKLIAERLSQVEDASKRAAIAQQIFGRSGTQLIPLFEDGAAGIEALQEQARELGLTISTDTAKSAAALVDAFNIVRKVLRATAISIGSALAPMLIRASETMTEIAKTVSDWASQNRELVVTIAKVGAGVVAAGAAIIGFGFATKVASIALGGYAFAAKAAAVAMGAFKVATAALVSPIGLAVVAVGAATAAFLAFTKTGNRIVEFVGSRIRSLLGVVQETMDGIRDALAGGDLALAARVLWAGIKAAFLEGIQPIQAAWLRFRQAFEKVAIEAFHGVEVAWIQTQAFFEKNFPGLTETAAKFWAEFTSVGGRAMARLRNFASDVFLEIMGFFDEDLDVDAAKALGADELKKELEEIRDARREAIEEAERRSRRSTTEREDELAEDLRNAEDRFRDAKKALDDAAGDRIDDARRSLEEAKKGLEEAQDEARREREEADRRRQNAPEAKDPLDRFDQFAEQLASAGETVSRKGATAVGAFSGFGTRGLETAEPLRAISSNVEELLREFRRFTEGRGEGIYW